VTHARTQAIAETLPRLGRTDALTKPAARALGKALVERTGDSVPATRDAALVALAALLKVRRLPFPCPLLPPWHNVDPHMCMVAVVQTTHLTPAAHLRA